MAGIQYIFGGGGIRAGRGFGDPSLLPEAFQILENNGCKKIDTAALYGESEEYLGKAKGGDKFVIDTKTKGGFGGKGHASKDIIIAEAKHSREMLGCHVDVFYIHGPDSDTPLEDTLKGINEVFKTGFFKRFGLSNYKAEDVEKVYNHCKEQGYPLPSVYQGNYSAVARRQEDVLFPTLRKLNISFFAYSPIAGGFLTKTKEEVQEGKGRFNPQDALGEMYSGMYAKPALLNALEQWAQIAQDEGVSRAELAYRWVTYNSALKKENGDGIIIGARNVQQLEETLKSVNNGPLSRDAIKRIDEVWKTIEHEAPLDNYHR